MGSSNVTKMDLRHNSTHRISIPSIVEKREMATELMLGDESVPVTRYDTDFAHPDKSPNSTAVISKTTSALENINLLGSKVKKPGTQRNRYGEYDQKQKGTDTTASSGRAVGQS